MVPNAAAALLLKPQPHRIFMMIYYSMDDFILVKYIYNVDLLLSCAFKNLTLKLLNCFDTK